jgi:hypothetical protein
VARTERRETKSHSGRRIEIESDDRLLGLDQFCSWFSSTVNSGTCVEPEAQLSNWLGEDVIMGFRFSVAFDDLTGALANPTADIEANVTIRDLYLYYLYVLSRPLETE